MTSALIVIGAAFVCGIPVSLLLDAQRRTSARAGESFMFGAGIVWAVMMILPALGIGWSRTAFATAMLVTIAALWFAAVRRAGNWEIAVPKAHLLDVATIATIAGYAILATIAPPTDYDYLTDFGLKAKAFWEIGAIDWNYVRSVSLRSFHPDYPLFLPLLYDAVAAVAGKWTDASLGLFNVAFAAAGIGVVRGELAERADFRAWESALLTLAIAPLLLSPWIGIADGPFAALFLAAVLRFRSALARGEGFASASLLVGLSASMKNEGLALIAGVALALVALRSFKVVIRLWPAVAVALPWAVMSRVHSLPNDITSGNFVARIVERIGNPWSVIGPIVHEPLGRPLLWLGLVIGMASVIRALLASERFTLIVVAVQFASYVAAYFATPHDIGWHVRWSWERVASHVTPTVTFLVVLYLWRALRGTAAEAGV